MQQPQPLQFVQEDRERIEILTDKLMALKDVSIAGQLAMRPLDEAHVETLMASNPSKWDPIKITRLSGGYCYYDGQHRLEASRRMMQVSLIADCKTFKSEEELIDAAFQANLRHGKPATIEYRGDYAFWLYLTFGDKLTQTQIAQLAGMHQGSVSKAIAKREQSLRQMMDGNEQDHKDKQDDALKDVKKFIHASKKFYTVVHTEEYRRLVQEMHDTAKTVDERDALYFLGQLLIDAMKPPALLKFPSQSLLEGNS